MKLLKLLLTAIIAWILGLASIAAILYFTNDGVDFTLTDLTGFGSLAVVVSGLMMLVLYLPTLYWLKRRRGGVTPRLGFLVLTGLFCNIPLFTVFGLGFTLAQHESR